jgi:glucose/arabinose dehydrogenase
MKYCLYSAFLLVWLFACSQNEQSREAPFEGAVIESEKQKFGIDTLTAELANPWGIAFLPDGRILVAERAGEIRIVKDGKLLAEKIGNVPEVYANGQGGLMDIKLHPDYAINGWIYLTYSKPGPGGGGTTISRAKLDGNNLVDIQEVFVAEPFSGSSVHFGSRIVFDGKGHIFFSSGERGKKENAQDLTNHLGKMLRLHEDGKVPDDNPFVNTPGARPEIWSYGHRNPQGVVFDASTQTLWAVEHGPRGGDELNRVEPGKNYGWPVITYGINYDGSIITDLTEKEGMEQPVFYWVPSIAPCGMAMVTSDRYPNWKGNLMVTALALQHIARVELDEQGNFIKQERLLDKIGRVRAIEQSPDGYLYVVTETPGMLLRIVPVK